MAEESAAAAPVDDVLAEARERYDRGLEFDEQNREDALDDLLFLSGEQWPQEILLARAGRPTLMINRLTQFVRQVTNDIRMNKPAIAVRPVDGDGDPKLAEVYEGLIRDIEQRSDAASVYGYAGELAASCGMAAFRVLTEWADDDALTQQIVIRRIRSPFAVVWDPDAEQPAREDAKWCFVVESLSRKAFEAKYPDAQPLTWPSNQTPDYIRSWMDGDRVKVAEYWRKVPVKRWLALLPNGATIDVTQMERGMVDMLGAVRVVERQSHRVEMFKLTGSQILEGPTEWPGKYIPIVPVFGEEVVVGDDIRLRGVIRFAKDAQRMYNYFRSAHTEAVALQPKAPYKLTPANIEGLEAFWNSLHAENRPYLPYNPDPKNGGQAPQRDTPPVSSPGIVQEIGIAADDMKATTGVYDAALGNRSNETSGVAIRARQQESDISTFAYVDNLILGIKQCGRILVDLIPKVYDTMRVVRLLNEDGSEAFERINVTVPTVEGPRIVNDLSAGRYDVRVSAGPSFTTKREQAATAMLEFARAVPQSAAAIMDLIATNQDWPGAEKIAERLRKLLPPGLLGPDEQPEGAQPQQPPPPDPAQMASMQKLMADAEKAQAQAAAAAAGVPKAQAEAEMARLGVAEKQMELAAQNGALQQAVQAEVYRILAGMLGGMPPAPMAPPPGAMLPQ